MKGHEKDQHKHDEDYMKVTYHYAIGVFSLYRRWYVMVRILKNTGFSDVVPYDVPYDVPYPGSMSCVPRMFLSNISIHILYL